MAAHPATISRDGDPLLSGRSCRRRDDTASAPVAIVTSVRSLIWPVKTRWQALHRGNATLRPPGLLSDRGRCRHETLSGAPSIELYRPVTQADCGRAAFHLRMTAIRWRRHRGAHSVRSVDPAFLSPTCGRSMPSSASRWRAPRAESLLLFFAFVGWLGAVACSRGCLLRQSAYSRDRASLSLSLRVRPVVGMVIWSRSTVRDHWARAVCSARWRCRAAAGTRVASVRRSTPSSRSP